jgi:hypothetical protein
MKMQRWQSLFTVVCGIVALSESRADDIFPAQGIDSVTSIGQFTIVIDKNFRSYFPGLPKGGTFVSPVLQDSNTQIARSNAITEGSFEDKNGVPVGDGNTRVSDWNMRGIPNGFETGGPANREVHTEIVNFNLVGGGLAVRAGSQNQVLIDRYGAGAVPRSVGEVESKSGTGDPANDFPAQSFFDVFVNIDLPNGMVLYNTQPLLIRNNDVQSFPPEVVYMHENAAAIPVFVDLSTHKHVFFGKLTLAGHGLIKDPSQVNIATATQHLTESLQHAAPMALFPEPSSSALSLTGLGICLTVAWMRRRSGVVSTLEV